MCGPRRRLNLAIVLYAAFFAILTNIALGQDFGSARYAISAADVLKAISASGVNVKLNQVHVPVHMSASIASPNLQFVAAVPEDDDQVRLELRCPIATECLPFFATLEVKDAHVVAEQLQSKSDPVNNEIQQTTLQRGENHNNQPRIRVGSSAMLIIRDGHLDIHLKVVAIDSGVVGQQVRVSTLDRKKVFHATVTDQGVVTGVLE